MPQEKEDNKISSRYKPRTLHLLIAYCRVSLKEKSEFQRNQVEGFFKELERANPGLSDKLLKRYDSMSPEERKNPQL